MGMLGNYIDGLTPEQKDRVIEAQEWCTGMIKLDEKRCLAGHAEGDSPSLDRAAAIMELQCKWNKWLGRRFDNAVERFGMERMVACVKKRAAKPQFILPAVSRRTILQSSL